MVKHLKMLLGLFFLATSAIAEGLEDPTRPPVSILPSSLLPAESDAIPVLQSIIQGPEGRYAMINGHMVRLGKRFQSYKLISLQHDRVTLMDPSGKELELVMHSQVRKTLRISKPVADTPLNVSSNLGKQK